MHRRFTAYGTDFVRRSAGANRKGRKLARLGFEAFDEWSPDLEKALAALKFSADEVMGSWVPDR